MMMMSKNVLRLMAVRRLSASSFDIESVLSANEKRGLDELSEETLSRKSRLIGHSLLVRGREAVFDIEQLVEVLSDENVRDLYCVRRSKFLSPIAKYLLVGTCLSEKHCAAVTQYLNRLFKMKKATGDWARWSAGRDDSWKVLDLGVTFVHLFASAQLRERYDLENLWLHQ